MIEKYNFGVIQINGEIYDYDVEVRWTGEVLKWWRKEGHKIDRDDVKRAIQENPEIIVVGTGAYGMCEMTENCKEFIKKMGIKLIIDTTEEAVKTFNIILERTKREKETRVIGLFHLTC